MLVCIQVTQDDIDRGLPGKRYYCPIALACTRVLGPQFCAVEKSTVIVWKNGERLSIVLPLKVIHAIAIYDDSRIMQPMEFELEIS